MGTLCPRYPHDTFHVKRHAGRIRAMNPDVSALDATTRRTLAPFLERVRVRYPEVGAVLFGSRARGDHKPDSDADVAVLLSDRASGRFIPVKLNLVDVAFDVMLETGIRVEPLPIKAEEWAHPETYSNHRLLPNIAREEGCACEAGQHRLARPSTCDGLMPRMFTCRITRNKCIEKYG